MKRKELGRLNWSRVTAREDNYCIVSEKNPRIEASLIRIDKVKEKGIGIFRGEEVVIVEEGLSWLQIAVENTHWWLTAMLDSEGNIRQYYFDITLENHLLGSKESWFYDIYLDVVMMPNGEMDLLDEDELDEALESGDITSEQHKNAHIWAENLMKELPGKVSELEKFCKELFVKLRK